MLLVDPSARGLGMAVLLLACVCTREAPPPPTAEPPAPVAPLAPAPPRTQPTGPLRLAIGAAASRFRLPCVGDEIRITATFYNEGDAPLALNRFSPELGRGGLIVMSHIVRPDGTHGSRSETLDFQTNVHVRRVGSDLARAKTVDRERLWNDRVRPRFLPRGKEWRPSRDTFDLRPSEARVYTFNLLDTRQGYVEAHDPGELEVSVDYVSATNDAAPITTQSNTLRITIFRGE